MAQIAQQDHLYFPVESVGSLTADEIAGLLEKVKAGTILDTVLVDADGYQAKILAASATQITYYSIPDSEILTVTLE